MKRIIFLSSLLLMTCIYSYDSHSNVDPEPEVEMPSDPEDEHPDTD